MEQAFEEVWIGEDKWWSFSGCGANIFKWYWDHENSWDFDAELFADLGKEP